MNKIVLGTAQFGMNYGINNVRGKIPRGEAFEILSKAGEMGISALDTAYSYGDSESVIGEYAREYNAKFSIVSKLPKCENQQVAQYFADSCGRLNTDTLYGYLMHDFNNFKSDRPIWDALKNIRDKGRIKKAGFSVYLPAELEYLLKENIDFDILQLPYSVFDQRFAQYFRELKTKGVEIQVRSLFLQGLVFKNPENLDSRFRLIKKKLTKLHDLAAESGVPIVHLCMNFALLNDFVDKTVVGVDNISNFLEITDSLRFTDKVKQILPEFESISETDERIILPYNWAVK
jgi:aryl-alcohol dehydrogenase-like predicted oxidoreductase